MQQINVVESMIAESNLNEIFICPDLDRPNFFFNHISGGCACEWNSCIEEVVRMINSNPSTNNKKKESNRSIYFIRFFFDYFNVLSFLFRFVCFSYFQNILFIYLYLCFQKKKKNMNILFFGNEKEKENLELCR